MKHYFLTGEKWIPVLMRGGTAGTVSLLDIFEGERKISDLALPPAPRIAVMRLLLCIVCRSLPQPKTRHEWKSAHDRIAQRATDYLKRWEHAFDLYGEHPFLQATGLETSGTATLDKLDFTLSSGNNHTLFDHLASEAGRPHPPAWQALMLLVIQNFSAGGTIGANKWNGITTNILTGNISSPALEGSPLHAFLLGDDILETLYLNLIPLEELGELEPGIPVWEAPPKDASDAQRFSASILGRLAPISRAIKLPEEGESVSFAVGCNYAQLPEFIDPYLAVRSNPKDNTKSYLRVQPDRHPWRELESLLALQPRSATTASPPKNLRSRWEIAPGGTLWLWCGGIAVDKAKYEFSGEWIFSIQADALAENETLAELGKFAMAAEEVAGVLAKSVDIFWANLAETISDTTIKITSGKDRAKSEARARYWKRLDDMVNEFLASGGRERFDGLRGRLGRTAEDVFTASLPDSSPRGMMAFAKTMPYFRKGLMVISDKQNTRGGNEHEK